MSSYWRPRFSRPGKALAARRPRKVDRPASTPMPAPVPISRASARSIQAAARSRSPSRSTSRASSSPSPSIPACGAFAGDGGAFTGGGACAGCGASSGDAACTGDASTGDDCAGPGDGCAGDARSVGSGEVAAAVVGLSALPRPRPRLPAAADTRLTRRRCNSPRGCSWCGVSHGCSCPSASALLPPSALPAEVLPPSAWQSPACRSLGAEGVFGGNSWARGVTCRPLTRGRRPSGRMALEGSLLFPSAGMSSAPRGAPRAGSAAGGDASTLADRERGLVSGGVPMVRWIGSALGRWSAASSGGGPETGSTCAVATAGRAASLPPAGSTASGNSGATEKRPPTVGPKLPPVLAIFACGSPALSADGIGSRRGTLASFFLPTGSRRRFLSSSTAEGEGMAS
mmetsp:Transcript_69451/g.214840  ORF Transcript_69451/g.214840 Transcript_69451/m.214840 type:complete len:400 (-) Transcript_69451:201-1400(-)